MSLKDKLRKFIELNPVLLRGVLVTFAALLARIVGHEVIDEPTILAVVDFFIAVSALVTALWTRGVVIAENKVIAWKTDPADDTTIVAGPATVDTETELNEVYDASITSLRQGEARYQQSQEPDVEPFLDEDLDEVA